jgi:hypothetical protein
VYQSAYVINGVSECTCRVIQPLTTSHCLPVPSRLNSQPHHHNYTHVGCFNCPFLPSLRYKSTHNWTIKYQFNDTQQQSVAQWQWLGHSSIQETAFCYNSGSARVMYTAQLMHQLHTVIVWTNFTLQCNIWPNASAATCGLFQCLASKAYTGKSENSGTTQLSNRWLFCLTANYPSMKNMIAMEQLKITRTFHTHFTWTVSNVHVHRTFRNTNQYISATNQCA